MMSKSEIIIYQPEDTVKVEVRMEDETVWLTQTQIVALFQSSKANVSEHIKSIYQQGELDANSTVRNFRTVRLENNRQVSRNLTYYNLDAIISIGFRINSKRGIQFRQWANKILKEYLLRGYALNQRIETLEQRMTQKFTEYDKTLEKHSEKIDFFVRTALPPVEGVFFDGQIFDAYTFAADLIRRAKHSIVLIDNYVDDTVLTLLCKRKKSVNVRIYTYSIPKQLWLDLERYNTQYPIIEVHKSKRFHDRFLVIDSDVYHIGASLKDLGKKLFAFSRMAISIDMLLEAENKQSSGKKIKLPEPPNGSGNLT